MVSFRVSSSSKRVCDCHPERSESGSPASAAFALAGVEERSRGICGSGGCPPDRDNRSSTSAILSDERSEESKDPYRTCAAATRLRFFVDAYPGLACTPPRANSPQQTQRRRLLGAPTKTARGGDPARRPGLTPMPPLRG